MQVSCRNYKSFNRTRPARVVNLPKQHYRRAVRPAPLPELLTLLMGLACLLLVGAVGAGCSLAVASSLALGPAAPALMLAAGLLANEVAAALGWEVRYGR